MTLSRPALSETQKKNLKGKAGAPWKHGTREEEGGSTQDAYRDIRLEERFFLGNLTHRMSLKETGRDEHMRNYRPGSAEKERGREPHPFARMENEYGSVELGMDEQNENMTVAVAQKEDADRKTLPGSAKQLKGKSATPVRGMVGEKGNVMMAEHHPRQSALAFKTQAKRGYRDAVSLMKAIKARGGSETIEETLPFLSTADERAEEMELEDMARSEENEQGRNATAVRLHHIRRIRRLKEQRQKEFVQNLDLAIARQRTRAQKEEEPAPWWDIQRRVKQMLEEVDGGEDAGNGEEPTEEEKDEKN